MDFSETMNLTKYDIQRATTYDCYSPYFEDHEFEPNPKSPPQPIPGPPPRDMVTQRVTELGLSWLRTQLLPGREKWEGPEGGGVYREAGPATLEGSCAPEYLEFIGVQPKPDQLRPFRT